MNDKLLYNYFTKDQPIYITNETQILTPHTWNIDGKLWGEDSLQFFFNECKKIDNPIVIDIGAQTGLFTLLAKYLPNSHFYAYEPYYPSYKCLLDNLTLNNINNVTAINKGLSNNIGRNVLNVPEHKGLCTLGSNPLRFKNYEPIEVEITTLDNDFGLINNIDLIKIDTEGWEYFILQGGKNLIKKYKPKILLEFNDINLRQCSVTKQMLLNFISNELQYKIGKNFHEDIFIVPQ